MGFSISPWAVTALEEACAMLFHQYQYRTWDDVFGPPFPKGAHLSAIRTKQLKSIPIWGEIERQRTKFSAKLDAALFEEVGKQYGVGKTLCAELYYEQVKGFERGKAIMAKRQTSTNS